MEAVHVHCHRHCGVAERHGRDVGGGIIGWRAHASFCFCFLRMPLGCLGLDGDDAVVGGYGGDYGYEEVGGDDDDANDGTTTPARSGDRNGNYASNSTATATVGAASSCCDVPGRGPPRRAFQFLRSPVTTLTGVGRNRRGDEHSEHNGTDQADALALHGSDGDGADNLSLHEDDKMTPLL